MKKIYIFLCLCFISACTYIEQSDEIWIKNAQNEALYLKVDGVENASSQKLVFLQHGLASNMNHQVIQQIKKAFLANHYVVISFDSRYSLGNSGNDVRKVRLSTFREDLKTVISWAKTQPFYHEPFALSGHSLGGASVLQYSAQHPDQINLLIPVTPVISGQLWETSCQTNMADFCHQWQQNGSFNYTDPHNHKTAVIPYDVITDCKSYNAYKLAPKIMAKTLIVSAENDNIIPPTEVQKLIKSFKNNNISAIIPASGHNFEDKQNQTDLYHTVYDFIKSSNF